jgi:hypothetical protein
MITIEAYQAEVQAWNALFIRCVEDYHRTDDIDAKQPETPIAALALFYEKCWIDTVQWHLEDEIRRPDIDPSYGMQMKRRIDQSNQQRTDRVEQLDDWFMQRFIDVVPEPNARLNTESPAWAVDRLSILALKIYHMQVEVAREDADEAHIAKCRAKLEVLLQQREDLSLSIAQLLEDLHHGKRVMKVYRQMKMYNDPNLNPVLYKKRSL